MMADDDFDTMHSIFAAATVAEPFVLTPVMFAAVCAEYRERGVDLPATIREQPLGAEIIIFPGIRVERYQG